MILDKSLRWVFADYKIHCHIDGSLVPACWKKLYRNYTQPPSDSDLISEVDLYVTPLLDMEIPDENWGIEILKGDGFSIQQVDINVPGALGRLFRRSMRFSGEFRIEAAEDYGLSTLLHITLSMLVEEEGGLILHASGVLCDERVWLFCGPSGSGKTTIATKLRRKGERFSTDRVVVKFDSSGDLMAYSTPFGESPEDPSSPKSAPVAGILFISQAQTISIRKSNAIETVKTMFNESRWYSSSAIATQRTLNNIERIFQNCLCLNMEFTEDIGFWSLIDAWTGESVRYNKSETI